MMSSVSLAIVIPAKDEASSIASIISDIQCALTCMIIVVDDNSADQTASVARAAGAIVLTHVVNLGAWRATQTGIRYALKHGVSHVITCDADGQHPASAVKTLAECRGDNIDCLVGACVSRGSVARHLAWKSFRGLTGLTVSDLTSGLRLYSLRAMRLLAAKPATLFDYQDVGVLLMLQTQHMKIAEVEVQMLPREDGISRIFSSWSAVSKYMVYTLVLIITKLSIYKPKWYKKRYSLENKCE